MLLTACLSLHTDLLRAFVFHLILLLSVYHVLKKKKKKVIAKSLGALLMKFVHASAAIFTSVMMDSEISLSSVYILHIVKKYPHQI